MKIRLIKKFVDFITFEVCMRWYVHCMACYLLHVHRVFLENEGFRGILFFRFNAGIVRKIKLPEE